MPLEEEPALSAMHHLLEVDYGVNIKLSLCLVRVGPEVRTGLG